MTSAINGQALSLSVQRHLGTTQDGLRTSLQRISTGLRINSARDDAAGLAIAQRMVAQVRGMDQAARNAGDGISLAQTAEGALGAVGENLQRIRELAVQAANAGNSGADRAALQREVAQRLAEIDRSATQTAFNSTALLDGSYSGKVFQVGADAGQVVTMGPIASVRTRDLGAGNGFTALDQSFHMNGNVAYALKVSVAGGPLIDLGTPMNDSAAVSKVVNDAHIPGLTLSANVTDVWAGYSSANASGDGTAVYTVNGIGIPIAGVAGAAGLAANRASAVGAINARTAQTGVTARDDGSGVALQALDGRNITMGYHAGSFTGSYQSDFGLSSLGLMGTEVDIYYVAPPGVTGDVVFYYGWGVNTFAIDQTSPPLAAVDVSTADGARRALVTVDTALDRISASRADLGAVQNRFASIGDNLQNGSANLAAASGRILDADYVRETAALSRAQILQQAGLAMVAQANVQGRSVLALLTAE